MGPDQVEMVAVSAKDAWRIATPDSPIPYSPLLEDASVRGARGVIINVTGGPDMSLLEVNEALTLVHDAADAEAEIIFGSLIDEDARVFLHQSLSTPVMNALAGSRVH